MTTALSIRNDSILTGVGRYSRLSLKERRGALWRAFLCGSALLVSVFIPAGSAGAASTVGSRAIEISNVHCLGGTLASVDLSLEATYCATGEVFAAYAAADMGDDLGTWSHVVKVADVTEKDTALTCPVSDEWGEADYRALRFFLVSSVLKDGDYAKRLEYVDSSASSDVDIGVVPTANSRVETGVMRTIDAAQIAVHGVGGTVFSAWIGSQNDLNCRFLGRIARPNMQAKDLWYYFVQDSAAISYTDGNGTTKSAAFSGSSATSGGTIHLFNNGTDATYRKQLRLAYWRHYTNDVLVSSYVPVLLADGVTADLWDVVRGEAVNCAGLTAGPAIDFGASITNATASSVSYADTVASTVASREIVLAGTHVTDGRLSSVDVSLEPIHCAKGSLYAAFADADMGDDLGDWMHVVKVADVTEADTLVNCAVPALWGSAGYKALRVFLVSSTLKDGDYARRLEYVDSTPTADVDTGVRATALSRIESAFMRVEDNAQVILYGGGGTDSGKHLTGWLGTQADLPWRFAGIAARPNLLAANLWYYASQGYHAVPDRTSLVIVDGNGSAKTNNYSGVGADWVSTDTMHVFRNGLNVNNEQYRLPVRMAYWRHYTNDVLVTSYAPVTLLATAAAGFFESVAAPTVNCAGLMAGPAIDYGASITNATADVLESDSGDIPVFAQAEVTGTLGHTLSATGTVFVTSGDIAAVEVRLEYSADSEFADVVGVTGVCDATGTFEVDASVTPGATYYCRLVAVAASGRATTNVIGAVVAPGPSAIADGFVVDNSRGRQIAFTGTLSAVGIAPTYVLLQSGGETRASSVVDANGAWSLAWDARDDIAWTTAPVSFALVCSNECGQSVFVSQKSGAFELVDDAVYTWTGAGETVNWSDAGNWSSSLADCAGAPLCGGDAVFPDGTTADICLDADARLWNYAVGARDVSVSISAASARSFAVTNAFIVADQNDAAAYGSTFAFSGPISIGVRLVSTGKGSTVRLASGASLDSSCVFQMAVQNSAAPFEGTLEILSGASVTIRSEVRINGDALIVVDDAEFVVDSFLINCWAPGGTVRIAGASPSFRIYGSMFRSGSNVENGTGSIVFSIPVGGYASTEVRPGPFGYTYNRIGTFGGNAPISWLLDRDSPAFKSGGRRGTTPLWYSRTTPLDTAYHTLVPLRGFNSCEYTIDNEADPKTVALSWERVIGMRILIR